MTTQEINDQAQPVEILYCANHPARETLLRCNRCGKPICTDCAVLTDVGYRCPECIREVQNKYYNADQKDNAIAFGVAFGVALIATPVLGFLLSFFGFFFGSIIALMLGSGAGASLSQIIRQSVGKRRGRYLGAFATAGIIAGILVVILFIPFVGLNIPMLIFAALTISTAYPFLR